MSVRERLEKNLDQLSAQREWTADDLSGRSKTLLNISALTLLDGQFDSSLKFFKLALNIKILEVANIAIQKGEEMLPYFEEGVDGTTKFIVDKIDSLARS